MLAQNADLWQVSPRFAELLDLPESLVDDLSHFVPDFTMRLIQLAELGFEAIRGTPAGILTLRVMKAERLRQLLDKTVWDESLFLEVPREIIESIIRYILDADVDKAAFDSRVANITNVEVRSTAMTLAQQIRQEGRQEGRKEGQEEGLWIGKILNLQELMGLAPADPGDLFAHGIPELERRYEELRREYEARFRR